MTQQFTPAQLEAWAGLERLNWWSDGEITDLNGKSIGLVAFDGAEYLTAFAAAPDLARLVLEKDAEIAELKRLLAQASDAIEGRTDDLDERICCNGHQCGCMGATNRSFLLYHIRQAMKETSDE